MKCLLLLSLAAVLSSCVSTRPSAPEEGLMFTEADQVASMEGLGDVAIDRWVTTVAEGSPMKLNVHRYISLHSAMLLNGLSRPELETMLLGSFDARELDAQVEGREPRKWGALGMGSAAPISADGYLLTSSHCIQRGDTLAMLFTVTIAPRKDGLAAEPNLQAHWVSCRVVFDDPAADLAVIKVPIGTPNFLELRRAPLEPGERLFTGSFSNARGAGVFEWSEAVALTGELAGQSYELVISSVPTLVGDSGSGLIDAQGRLCGVTRGVLPSEGGVGPKSVAVRFEPDTILKIIENDRRGSGTAVGARAATPRAGRW